MSEVTGGRELKIEADVISEQVVIGAAVAGWDDGTVDRLLRIFGPDHFVAIEHGVIWQTFREMKARKQGFDLATARVISGGQFNNSLVDLVSMIADARPEVPENLDYHIACMLWDRSKRTALQGPIASLLEEMQDPKADQERIYSLARQIPSALQSGERKHLYETGNLVRQVMAQIRAMRGGVRYPFGIDGLDYFESVAAARSAGITEPEKLADAQGRVRRMLPGSEPGYITLVSGMSGGGKALDINTPIATVDGWTTMKDIRVGDKVFDELGQPCTVLHRSSIMRNRKCYKVEFSDGSTIVADAGHLWLTRTWSERMASYNALAKDRARIEKRRAGIKMYPQKASAVPQVSRTGSVKTTDQIAESVRLPPSGKDRSERANHSVELTKPLILPEVELPIHPYVLGVWLGDGTSAAGHFTCHTDDAEAISWAIKVSGYEVQKTNVRYRWLILGLQKQLRGAGLLKNKHIPDVYLRASIAQRLDLLRGLMDTDGCCTKDSGKCNFDSTNPRLVEGMTELLSSLGIKAKPNKRRAMLNGRCTGPSWRFVFVTDLRVFNLERKYRRQKPTARNGLHARRFIVSVDEVESVPVRCIMVDSPSHLFLAGRTMIPTHNSTLATAITLAIALRKRKILYCAWEPKSEMVLQALACARLGWSRQRVLQGMITAEEEVILQEKMLAIGQYVKFMGKGAFYDFGAARKKRTNQENLDIFASYVSDSGCDAVIGDLWKYVLVPQQGAQQANDEEEALKYQQAMCEEQRFHLFLLQQQVHKRMEMRSDKRPSREGVKGSGAYLEIVDTYLAPHIPSLWKPGIAADTFEIFVLKQRYGRWPLGIEFKWNADSGAISGGRSIPYDFDTGEVKAPRAAVETKDRGWRGIRGNNHKSRSTEVSDPSDV